MMHLRCVFCGCECPCGVVYACTRCGGSLEVVLDYPVGDEVKDMLGRVGDVWSCRPLLPVPGEDVEVVTLGEGGTPLVPALFAGGEARRSGVRTFLKNETVNPTLSFKDRFASVGVTAARAFGASGVVAASTGNTAVSVAAYAARVGVPCRIFVPAGTSRAKTGCAERFGAELVRVEGSFSDAHRAAVEEAEHTGAFNLTSTYLNPFAVEGNKTLAYEVFAALGRVPDWVIVPVGAGPLLWAAWKGFVELNRLGLADGVPRMVGVQDAGCAPIVRAFEEGSEEVRPWEGALDVTAEGIADPLSSYPRDGTRTLGVIRRSSGRAVAVGGDEIRRAADMLARRDGVLVEAAAAAAAAAWFRLNEKGHFAEGQTVVVVLTGHGAKE